MEVGDKVYVLRDTISFRLYQLEAEITSVESWPAYPRGRGRAYGLKMPDGTGLTSWHREKVALRYRQVVRKTRWPGVPVISNQRDLNQFLVARLKE